MKNSQKFILLLACISIIVSIVFILQAYAKYSTSITGTSEGAIARWNIIVNDQLITSDEELSDVLKLIFEENPHIVNGVWAPTAVRIL